MINIKERTLAILKPDSYRKKIHGDIISYIEKDGFNILSFKLKKLSIEEVKMFYSIHKDRPFFQDLIEYMVSDKVLILILECDDAVQKFRSLMGDTDPRKAQKGTIRGDFADNISENCVHGSDSIENAKNEISFFFDQNEFVK